MQPPLEPFYTLPAFWLYLGAWAMFVGCLLAYGIRSPWRQSGVGRAMFTLYASLSSILTMILLILTGLMPEALWTFMRSLTLGAVTIAGAIQLATILHHQRKRPPCEHPRRRSTDFP